MADAYEVAKYFLSLSDPEVGDEISNLKLQKLLYYAQGFHLALYGDELFNDPIEAWTHGPVVASVYRHYKEYGAAAIPRVTDVDKSNLSDKSIQLLVDVYEAYGQFTAWKLRNMTHDEPPWKDTPQNTIISHSSLMTYFKTQIEE